MESGDITFMLTHPIILLPWLHILGFRDYSKLWEKQNSRNNKAELGCRSSTFKTFQTISQLLTRTTGLRIPWSLQAVKNKTERSDLGYFEVLSFSAFSILIIEPLSLSFALCILFHEWQLHKCWTGKCINSKIKGVPSGPRSGCILHTQLSNGFLLSPEFWRQDCAAKIWKILDRNMKPAAWL